jgi:hypothetical protein
MTSDSKAMWLIGAGMLLITLAVGTVGLGWGWYKAGVQVEVYQREGIKMTQWEIFVGAKPAERTININPR